MKRILVFFLFLLTASSVWAASWTFESFANWENKPYKVTAVVPKADLAYLEAVYRVLGPKDFSFLYRKDRHHWAGLSRISNQMVFHIHDSTNLFNFRAVINRSTGGIIVHKGIQYKGKTGLLSAQHSAELALGYLTHLRKGAELFPGSKSFNDGPAAVPTPPKAPVKPSPVPEKPQPPKTDELSRLLEGNSRFVNGKSVHPNQTAERRSEVAPSQKPFAAVISCSDSRVPPEIVFDQGLGDLFVVRTAGEVATAAELGSLEYAVEHLGVKMILVLGHERCGAVEAAVKGGEVPDNIKAVLDQINPAITRARMLPGNLMTNGVIENAKEVLKNLEKSPVLKQALEKGHIKAAAAVLDLDTGAVEVLK